MILILMTGKIWKINIKITNSVNFKENIYKMFYRWYMTPDKMSKMYKVTLNICWKCKLQEGSLYHMWWTCTEAKIIRY